MEVGKTRDVGHRHEQDLPMGQIQHDKKKEAQRINCSNDEKSNQISPDGLEVEQQQQQQQQQQPEEKISLEGLDEPTRLLIATLQQQVVILRDQLMAALAAENAASTAADISLDDARGNLKDSLRRLMEGDKEAQPDYDYWDKVVSEHPEHIAEQARLEIDWERNQLPINRAALKLTRAFVPPDIQSCTLDKLVERGVPLLLAKRLFAKKCLWAVRMDSKLVAKLHLADLRGKFSTQGLDVIELRAVYAAFPIQFENDPTDDKRIFRDELRSKLVSMVDQQRQGKLSLHDQRHVAYMVEKGSLSSGVENDAKKEDGENQGGRSKDGASEGSSFVPLGFVFDKQENSNDDAHGIGSTEDEIEAVKASTHELITMVENAAEAYTEKHKQQREKQLKRRSASGSKVSGRGGGDNPLMNALAASFAKRDSSNNPALHIGKSRARIRKFSPSVMKSHGDGSIEDVDSKREKLPVSTSRSASFLKSLENLQRAQDVLVNRSQSKEKKEINSELLGISKPQPGKLKIPDSLVKAIGHAHMGTKSETLGADKKVVGRSSSTREATDASGTGERTAGSNAGTNVQNNTNTNANSQQTVAKLQQQVQALLTSQNELQQQVQHMAKQQSFAGANNDRDVRRIAQDEHATNKQVYFAGENHSLGKKSSEKNGGAMPINFGQDSDVDDEWVALEPSHTFSRSHKSKSGDSQSTTPGPAVYTAQMLLRQTEQLLCKLLRPKSSNVLQTSPALSPPSTRNCAEYSPDSQHHVENVRHASISSQADVLNPPKPMDHGVVVSPESAVGGNPGSFRSNGDGNSNNVVDRMSAAETELGGGGDAEWEGVYQSSSDSHQSKNVMKTNDNRSIGDHISETSASRDAGLNVYFGESVNHMRETSGSRNAARDGCISEGGNCIPETLRFQGRQPQPPSTAPPKNARPAAGIGALTAKRGRPAAARNNNNNNSRNDSNYQLPPAQAHTLHSETATLSSVGGGRSRLVQSTSSFSSSQSTSSSASSMVDETIARVSKANRAIEAATKHADIYDVSDTSIDESLVPVVERILAHRVVTCVQGLKQCVPVSKQQQQQQQHKQQLEFLVHWSGRPSSDDEWFAAEIVRKEFPDLVGNYVDRLLLSRTTEESRDVQLELLSGRGGGSEFSAVEGERSARASAVRQHLDLSWIVETDIRAAAPTAEEEKSPINNQQRGGGHQHERNHSASVNTQPKTNARITETGEREVFASEDWHLVTGESDTELAAEPISPDHTGSFGRSSSNRTGSIVDRTCSIDKTGSTDYSNRSRSRVAWATSSESNKPNRASSSLRKSSAGSFLADITSREDENDVTDNPDVKISADVSASLPLLLLLPKHHQNLEFTRRQLEVRFLLAGQFVHKVPRKLGRAPARRVLWIDKDLKRLHVAGPIRGAVGMSRKGINIADMHGILLGAQTQVMEAFMLQQVSAMSGSVSASTSVASRGRKGSFVGEDGGLSADQCFSVTSAKRSFDFVCHNVLQRNQLVTALRLAYSVVRGGEEWWCQKA